MDNHPIADKAILQATTKRNYLSLSRIALLNAAGAKLLDAAEITQENMIVAIHCLSAPIGDLYDQLEAGTLRKSAFVALDQMSSEDALKTFSKIMDELADLGTITAGGSSGELATPPIRG